MLSQATCPSQRSTEKSATQPDQAGLVKRSGSPFRPVWRLAGMPPWPYHGGTMSRSISAQRLALAFLLVCGSAGASAQEQARTIRVAVSGKDIAIAAPHGYCDIDPDNRRDSLLVAGLDALPDGSRVLRRLAPCNELKAWRVDKSPDLPELVQITAPPVTMAGNQKPGRAGWLEAVAGNRPPLGVATMKKIGERGFPANVRNAAPLGLIEKDGRAVHVADAMVASFDGESHELLSMRAWTMTLNTGVPLLVRSLRPFDTDPQTFDVAIVEQRDHVDRLLSANGEPSRRFSPNRPPPVAQPRFDVPKTKPRPTVRGGDDFFGRYGGFIALGMVGAGLALMLASRVGGRFVRRPI